MRGQNPAEEEDPLSWCWCSRVKEALLAVVLTRLCPPAETTLQRKRRSSSTWWRIGPSHPPRTTSSCSRSSSKRPNRQIGRPGFPDPTTATPDASCSVRPGFTNTQNILTLERSLVSWGLTPDGEKEDGIHPETNEGGPMVFSVSRLRRTRAPPPHPRLAMEPPPCRQEERTQPLSVLICEPHVLLVLFHFCPHRSPGFAFRIHWRSERGAASGFFFFFFHVL